MVHRDEEAEIRDNLCVRNDNLYVKYQNYHPQTTKSKLPTRAPR
jgi:hypothetical protein